jgi:hypothetical protein
VKEDKLIDCCRNERTRKQVGSLFAVKKNNREMVKLIDLSWKEKIIISSA